SSFAQPSVTWPPFLGVALACDPLDWPPLPHASRNAPAPENRPVYAAAPPAHLRKSRRFGLPSGRARSNPFVGSSCSPIFPSLPVPQPVCAALCPASQV